MKKLFLILFATAATFSASSCSDDDAAATTTGDTVTFKVNGVQKTYNTVSVEEETEGGVTYLYVTAMNGTNISEVVTFDIVKGETADDSVNGFVYDVAGVTYENVGTGTSFSSEIDHNMDGHIEGRFTGTLREYFGTSEEPVFKTFTEGSFNISY